MSFFKLCLRRVNQKSVILQKSIKKNLFSKTLFWNAKRWRKTSCQNLPIELWIPGTGIGIRICLDRHYCFHTFGAKFKIFGLRFLKQSSHYSGFASLLTTTVKRNFLRKNKRKGEKNFVGKCERLQGRTSARLKQQQQQRTTTTLRREREKKIVGSCRQFYFIFVAVWPI
jgi:hypothetical protein